MPIICFSVFLVVTSDYECLSQMNSAALDKYNQMHRQVQRVNNSIRTMNDNNGKITDHRDEGMEGNTLVCSV